MNVARTPILMYHEVTDEEPLPEEVLSSWTVTPEGFAAHLDALDRAGYAGVSVSRWLAEREDAPTTRRPVVITFDDGFRGSARSAIPMLAERGWSATFFIISGRMAHPSYAKPADWRRAAEAGMEIASHTATHPFMAVLDDVAARRELRDSRLALEEAAQTRVTGFSWPNGDAHPRGRALLEEAGYAWAADSRPAFATRRASRWALPRLPVRRWHDTEGLLRLLDEGWARRARLAALYEFKRIARAALGRRRYAALQKRALKDV